MKHSKQTWSESIRPVTGYPKMNGVVEALERLARELGPETRLPRTRELSKALGVTVVTLNLGLAQLERRGLLDRRPRSGIFVSPNIAQKTVGLVLGWNIFSERVEDATFYSLLLACCAKRAELNRERFSIFLDTAAPNSASTEASPQHHQDLVDALSGGRLDGLLLISSQGPEQDQWLRSYGVPLVTLNTTDQPGCVGVDYEGLIRMAAGELMSMGVRSIGLITAFPPEVACFRRVAIEMGFHFEEAWIALQVTAGSNESLDEQGRMGAREIMGRSFASRDKGFPNGLIIGNDLMARGACSYFSEKGIGIGESLQVVSHANKGSHILQAWEERISRCEADPNELAEAMFSQLETLMAGKSLDAGIKVSPHLRRRRE